jgi:hypothetical protein
MRFKKIKSRSLTCLIILLFTTLLKAEKPPTSDNVNKPKKQKTVYYSTSPVDMNGGTKLTREELDKFCAWIDLCVPYCGDYMENNIWDEKTEKKYIHYHTKRESLAEENRRSTELLYKKRSGKTLKLQDPEPRYKNYFKKKEQAKWDELETIHKVEPYKPTPGTRNVALNPNAFAGGFPQVTTNNQYPKITNNGLFAANNIINGKTSNKGHGHNGLNGEHFPSWGPNVADNIWVKIDLGKKHEVDMVVIYIRADFSPYREGDHDSYFKSGTLEFSDGPKVPFKLKRNAKAQAIKFKARSTSSVKITDLVMAKRKWSGLSEVQVYGK